MNRATLLAAGLAGALLAAAMPAQAACERHIVNRSSQPWTFAAVPRSSGRGAGSNVYFSGGTCREGGRTCVIPPGASVRVKYTTSGGAARGVMYIRDHTGKERSFDYATGWTSSCPYVRHSGNTGAVAVNDPADGDWNAWADQW